MGSTCPTASATGVTSSGNSLDRDVCLALCTTRLDVLNALFLKLFHCTTAALPPLTPVGRYSLPAHVISLAQSWCSYLLRWMYTE